MSSPLKRHLLPPSSSSLSSPLNLLLILLYVTQTIQTLTPTPTQNLNNTLLAIRAAPPLPTELSTCGYLNGDPERIRTANEGYNCRIDTANGLWGFCPTTVIAARDCGLAAECVELRSCRRGCSPQLEPDLTRFTCSSGEFCSTALLTFGVDQTYSYIACGKIATTESYLIFPTAVSTTSEILTSSSISSETSTIRTQQDTIPSLLETNTESPPSDSSSSDSSPSSQDTNLGAIIGGAIGGLALICLSTVAIIYILRRYRKSSSSSSSSSKSSSSSEKATNGRRRKGGEPPAYTNDDRHNSLKHWIPQEMPATPRKIPQFFELES